MKKKLENPWKDEKEYLTYLNAERQLYAWCLVRYGKYNGQEALEASEEFYEYEPIENEYRGLVFHDEAWHWAMLKAIGEFYWKTHSELADPTQEYRIEANKQHENVSNKSL